MPGELPSPPRPSFDVVPWCHAGQVKPVTDTAHPGWVWLGVWVCVPASNQAAPACLCISPVWEYSGGMSPGFICWPPNLDMRNGSVMERTTGLGQTALSVKSILPPGLLVATLWNRSGWVTTWLSPPSVCWVEGDGGYKEQRALIEMMSTGLDCGTWRRLGEALGVGRGPSVSERTQVGFSSHTRIWWALAGCHQQPPDVRNVKSKPADWALIL